MLSEPAAIRSNTRSQRPQRGRKSEPLTSSVNAVDIHCDEDFLEPSSETICTADGYRTTSGSRPAAGSRTTETGGDLLEQRGHAETRKSRSSHIDGSLQKQPKMQLAADGVPGTQAFGDALPSTLPFGEAVPGEAVSNEAVPGAQASGEEDSVGISYDSAGATFSETFAQQYLTNREFYHDISPSGLPRLVLLLSATKEIGEATRAELAKYVSLRKSKRNHMYYKSSSSPVVLKLDSVICFQGVREDYSQPESKLVSFDGRLGPRKGEKHLGILSVIESLAKIGAAQQVGSLQSKVETVRSVIESKDNLRSFPGAKWVVMPCPSWHETCAQVWARSDSQNNSIKAHLSTLPRSGQEFTQRSPQPLCLFVRKIVRPEHTLPKPFPDGVFVTPPQFNPLCRARSLAYQAGLRPFTYSVAQLRNVGPGKQKLLQCVVKPHYKALWSKTRKAFRPVEVIHGTYELAGVYLEGAEKMNLRLEVLDELVTPLEGRVSELQVHEGEINFNPEVYEQSAENATYSDDEDTIPSSNDMEANELNNQITGNLKRCAGYPDEYVAQKVRR